jgi:uncharacterized MAPEG superfamily protein
MTEYQFYALVTVILFFKMTAISIVQGVGRARTQTFVIPEDAPLFGGAAPAVEETPMVRRASMAWRNDLENIPMFLFLGLIYVTLGCWPTGAFIYFSVFLLARIAHTITFLRAIQPLRTIFFTLGAVVMLLMSVHILISVL